MKSALFAFVIFGLITTVLVSRAKADGTQVCVDSNGSTYTAKVHGFAKPEGDWSATLTADSQAAIANDTDLSQIATQGNLADSTSPSVEDLSFTLKHLVAPTADSLIEGAEISYSDEPRFYQVNGIDLVCSSTMSESEYAGLAK